MRSRPFAWLALAVLFLRPAGAEDFDAALKPVESLDINQSLWGQAVPNVLKGIPVAYDAKRNRVYTAGITSRYLAITDPAVGHPTAAVDLGLGGFHVLSLHLDAGHDRLFVVSHNDGSLRLVDLSAQPPALAARFDPEPEQDRKRTGRRSEGGARGGGGTGAGADRYPIKAAALDLHTGTLYVANSTTGRINAHDPATLRVTASLTEARSPFDLAWDPARMRLLVLDIAGRNAATLRAFAPETRQWSVVRQFDGPEGRRPPRRVACCGDAILLAGDLLHALEPDGRERWTARCDPGAHQMLDAGDGVAIVCREGASGPEENAAWSTVVVLDLADGKRRGRCKVGFEASWGAVDRAGGRLLVGNGGDGSVSVVDLVTVREVERWDVANSVEAVAVDPQTGRRFLLNRLGGSEIYVWKPGESVLARWHAGGWPVDLAVDAPARRLYVLNHYEAALRVFDLDSDRELPALALGLPGSRTDSLADLAIDADAGLAACAFPECGQIAVVDLRAGKVLRTWQPEGFEARESSGPGRLCVAIDGGRRRILAYGRTQGSLWSLDLKDGSVRAPLRLRRTETGRSYGIDLLTTWSARNLAFAGGTAIDLETWQVRAEIPGVDRVLGALGHRLFGMAVTGSGVESLVEIAADTLRPMRSWQVAQTDAIRTNASLDPAGGRVYVADMVAARVTVFVPPR